MSVRMSASPTTSSERIDASPYVRLAAMSLSCCWTGGSMFTSLEKITQVMHVLLLSRFPKSHGTGHLRAFLQPQGQLAVDHGSSSPLKANRNLLSLLFYQCLRTCIAPAGLLLRVSQHFLKCTSSTSKNKDDMFSPTLSAPQIWVKVGDACAFSSLENRA